MARSATAVLVEATVRRFRSMMMHSVSYKTALGFRRGLIQFFVEDGPYLLDGVVGIKAILLVQSIGNVTNNVGQQDSPADGLFVSPGTDGERAVQTAIGDPGPQHFSGAGVGFGGWRNYQLVVAHVIFLSESNTGFSFLESALDYLRYPEKFSIGVGRVSQRRFPRQ